MPQQTFENQDIFGDIRSRLNSNATDAESRMSSNQAGVTSAQTRLDALEGGQGFEDANDTTGPVALASGVWTAVPNNGAGPFSNTAYRPEGVSQLFDTTAGKFDPTELSLGDVIFIRNDFEVTPSVNGAYLEYRYTLGAGANAYTLPSQLGTLSNGAGVGYRFAVRTDKIYMGDTNTRDNLIGLEIKCSEPATLVNAGSVVSVVRGNNP